MKKLVVIISVFMTVGLNAQSLNKKPIRSYLMPQISLLNGDQETAMQLQIAGGIIKGSWYFGLGTGIDNYQLRSIPLFTDIRFSFGKEKKAFAYCNPGYNFHWVTQSDDKMYIMPVVTNESTFSGGLYADIGVGYHIPIRRASKLSLSIGYSVKQMSEQYEEGLIWIWPGPGISPNPGTTMRKFDYTFRRISFAIGYQLW